MNSLKSGADMTKNGYDVIVVGGGPAGLSAAQYASRAGLKTLVIDKNPLSGALGSSSMVENYPGVLSPMPGPELLNLFRKQAEKFGAEIIKDQVHGIDFTDENRTVFAGSGEYRAPAIIIATGSMGRKPSIEGEERLTGRGVSYCATCDASFHSGKEAAIAGYISEIAEELDQILKHVSKVHLVPQTKGMTDELRGIFNNEKKINLIENAKLKSINGENSVSSITIAEADGSEKEIEVSAVFLYLHGNKPVVDFLYESLQLSEEGCLIVNKEDMSTSIPGVFAAGDVSCRKVRQVVLATSEGCLAALSAERFLSKRDGFRAQWGG